MSRYFRPNGFSTCAFSLYTTDQVLKFHRKARMRVTPPLHRTPHGQLGKFPPRRSRNPLQNSGFDVIWLSFDVEPEVHLRSSLSFTPDAVKPRLLTIPFTTAVFRPEQLMAVEASSYKAASAAGFVGKLQGLKPLMP